MKEQMQNEAVRKQAKAQKYFETWSRTDVGEGLLDIYAKDKARALRTAWQLNNVERHLRTMKEDTIKSNFGTVPENVLKIVRIGAANSNRANLVTEVPLETTDDAIFYLKYTFGAALRGASVGDHVMESIAAYSPGEQYPPTTIGTGNGANLTFAFTGLVFPSRPYSYQVLVNGKAVGTDDGISSFSGTTVDTAASTLSYAAGTGTVVFTAGNAPALGAVVAVIYSFDSEVTGNYPLIQQVSIEIEKRRFHAQPVPLGYNFSGMTELLLGTTGFGDANEILLQGVGLTHAKMKDYRAIGYLKSVALGNAQTVFDADFAANGEISDLSQTQKITKHWNKVESDVQNVVGRGELNRILVGGDAGAYIQNRLSDFVEDTSQPRTGGTYLLGRVGSREIYKVVQDASSINLVAPNEILMTYHNPLVEGDSAVTYGVLAEMSDSLRYPTHETRGQVTSIEDAILYESRFMRLMSVANLSF
jgi:hypothetical protein